MKKCIWCEYVDEDKVEDEFFYIHKKCFETLTDKSSAIDSILLMLKKEHPRNKSNKDKIFIVCEYLKDMQAFSEKWHTHELLLERIMQGNKDGKDS